MSNVGWSGTAVEDFWIPMWIRVRRFVLPWWGSMTVPGSVRE